MYIEAHQKISNEKIFEDPFVIKIIVPSARISIEAYFYSKKCVTKSSLGSWTTT